MKKRVINTGTHWDSVRHLLAILSLAFTTAAVANEEHISYSYSTAKGGIEVLEAVVSSRQLNVVKLCEAKGFPFDRLSQVG